MRLRDDDIRTLYYKPHERIEKVIKHTQSSKKLFDDGGVKRRWWSSQMNTIYKLSDLIKPNEQCLLLYHNKSIEKVDLIEWDIFR